MWDSLTCEDKKTNNKAKFIGAYKTIASEMVKIRRLISKTKLVYISEIIVS